MVIPSSSPSLCACLHNPSKAVHAQEHQLYPKKCHMCTFPDTTSLIQKHILTQHDISTAALPDTHTPLPTAQFMLLRSLAIKTAASRRAHPHTGCL